MENSMRFLVIGLGSMGKRRIRCLQTIGFKDIVGFDLRNDRCEESNRKYQIKCVNSFDSLDLHTFNAMIISTPPDVHLHYIKIAIENEIPAFIEASVILDHTREAILENRSKNVLLSPSCTLKYHPIIKEIKKILDSGEFGRMTNFSYHCGQYLPDWHPWEDVKDFYVSKRDTGGAREIVPFELTWITDVFGFPTDLKGFFHKTCDVGADIEDTYVFSLKYENSVGTIIIEVVSRFATRNLIINLEKAQLRWNWEDKVLKLYDSTNNRWIHYYQPEGVSESGYNTNIIEQMYVDEIKAFIDAINTRAKYPNTLENDLKILGLLNEIEKSDGGFNEL